MKTDTIVQLIEDSDLPRMQKNIWKGFIHRNNEIETQRSELTDKMYKGLYGGSSRNRIESFFQFDNYVIANVIDMRDKTTGPNSFANTWKTFNTETVKWIDTCSMTAEQQILVTLGRKYIGTNTDFTYLVCRMLGIKID